jgi:prevent-host-death family protein
MSTTWQLQEAKSRLSEVVKLAIHQGPQSITVHGEPAVVLISHSEYLRLIHPKPRFVDFMRQSPLMEQDIIFTRDNSTTRELEL